MKIKILFALSISLAFLLFSSCKEEDEQITITVKSSNPECAVAGSGTYYKGSEISIAAIPGDGFRFVRWDDGIINNPRRIIVEFSTIYVAMFETTGSGGGGTTVPNAPTGVTVTNEGNAAIPSIKISWNSVSNATSYKVYRSSSSTGSYSQLGSGTSSTYAYDNNPMSGYNYYKVKAVNSAGESSFSSYGYYNNDGGASKYSPCPPTVSVNGTSSQSVSWTSSTSSGCGTPTSFEVYKYDPSSGKWELKTTTTSHSYSVPSSAVHPGINRYAVKAINSAGSATNYGYSSEVSLSKPSSFSAQKQGSDYVKFTWSAVSKATGYQIFVSTSSSGTYSILKQIDDGSTTTTTVYYPGASGTTYYFKIKAVYSCDLFIVYSDLTTYKSVKF